MNIKGFYIQFFNISVLTDDAQKHLYYNIHKMFGVKCFTYKRNDHTLWYIIYNWDKLNRVAYINKIISNHITSE